MRRLLSFLIAILTVTSLPLFSKPLSLRRNELTFGRQSIALHRQKAGSVQHGVLQGWELTYDRLKRYGWYVGVDAAYAKGKLKGESLFGSKLHSTFSQGYAEGLFGYTFQQKTCFQVACTPFVGGGYLQQKNHFSLPSPLPVHFKTTYSYAAAGIRLFTTLFWGMDVSLIAKVKFPVEPSCTVTHDPENDSVSQKIGERPHYRIDLPINYALFCDGRVNLQLKLFYEVQNFGKRINMPFDYAKTRLRFWGTACAVDLRL